MVGLGQLELGDVIFESILGFSLQGKAVVPKTITVENIRDFTG